MCDGIKDIELLKKQYENARNNNIEIIQIEFISGKIRYRDTWTVKEIIDRLETSNIERERIVSMTRPMKLEY